MRLLLSPKVRCAGTSTMVQRLARQEPRSPTAAVLLHTLDNVEGGRILPSTLEL